MLRYPDARQEACREEEIVSEMKAGIKVRA